MCALCSITLALKKLQLLQSAQIIHSHNLHSQSCFMAYLQSVQALSLGHNSVCCMTDLINALLGNVLKWPARTCKQPMRMVHSPSIQHASLAGFQLAGTECFTHALDFSAASGK